MFVILVVFSCWVVKPKICARDGRGSLLAETFIRLICSWKEFFHIKRCIRTQLWARQKGTITNSCLLVLVPIFTASSCRSSSVLSVKIESSADNNSHGSPTRISMLITSNMITNTKGLHGGPSHKSPAISCCLKYCLSTVLNRCDCADQPFLQAPHPPSPEPRAWKEPRFFRKSF